jgi:hypothetical protein
MALANQNQLPRALARGSIGIRTPGALAQATKILLKIISQALAHECCFTGMAW